MFKKIIQLRLERGISLGILVSLLQLQNERHQGFGHETTTINAKQAALIRAGAKGIGKGCHCCSRVKE